jgi:hypothetical protein
VPASSLTCTLPAFLVTAVAQYADYVSESDKVRAKIQSIVDILHPREADEPNGVVPNPTPLTDGERKLNQAKSLIEQAKAALDDLKPEDALAKLREAKAKIKDADVRKDIRDKGLKTSWYDLLEELQAMVEYLEKLTRD